jgi:hypothetical protein
MKLPYVLLTSMSSVSCQQEGGKSGFQVKTHFISLDGQAAARSICVFSRCRALWMPGVGGRDCCTRAEDLVERTIGPDIDIWPRGFLGDMVGPRLPNGCELSGRGPGLRMLF